MHYITYNFVRMASTLGPIKGTKKLASYRRPALNQYLLDFMKLNLNEKNRLQEEDSPHFMRPISLTHIQDCPSSIYSIKSVLLKVYTAISK